MASQPLYQPYTPPTPVASKPNIRVVFNSSTATAAVARAGAQMPAAILDATLEELAIADQARAVVADAQRLLSPGMYHAFLVWGEAASQLSTLSDRGDEDDAHSEQMTAALAVLQTTPSAGSNDMAFTTYLLALEASESSAFGPIRDMGEDSLFCVELLARSVYVDVISADPVAFGLQALATEAWQASRSTLGFSPTIGKAITDVFTQAIEDLEAAAKSEPAPDVLPTGYNRYMRGPYIAWRRAHDAYVAAHTTRNTYERDVYNPAAPEIDDPIQLRYDDLVAEEGAALDRLLTRTAPSLNELAIKLELLAAGEEWRMAQDRTIAAKLVEDVRRFSRYGAGSQAGDTPWYDGAPFYGLLVERNALIARLDGPQNGLSDAEIERENDFLCSRVNVLENQILNGTAQGSADAIIKLVALAQVSAEGHEPTDASVRSAVRDAKRHLGIGYLYEPAPTAAEQAA